MAVLSGIEKFFQFARCFRVEKEEKVDRQPEFTQLDLEQKVNNTEEIMAVVEDIFKKTAETLDKRVPSNIPIMTYDEAIRDYGTDKPFSDSLEICWVTGNPLFEKQGSIYVISHHPFAKPTEESQKFLNSDPSKVRVNSYDLIYKGFEIGGGDLRNDSAETQRKILEIIGMENVDAYKFVIEELKEKGEPHGGFAFGWDRVLMTLLGKENIQEVIAFPKLRFAKNDR
jgi:aspartyl-tRNA synthetase